MPRSGSGGSSFTAQELKNANLQLVHYVRELEALYEITAVMSSGRERGDFFARLAGHAAALTEVRCAAFFLRREGDGAFDSHPAKSSATATVLLPAEALENFHRRLAAGDRQVLRSSKDIKLFFPRGGSTAGVLLPLTVEGVLEGFLAVADKRKNSLDEDDFRVLSLLTGQAVEYLTNRRLAREKERRLKDLVVLHEVHSLLDAEPDLSKTLRGVAKKVAEALGAEVCAFLLHEEATNELVTQPCAWGLPEGERSLLYRVQVEARTSSGRVFTDKKPLLVEDALRDPRVTARSAKLWNYRSLMVVPLVIGGKCIGVLRAGHNRPGMFSSDHLRLAGLVAEHAAVVVENARLYRRVQEDMKEFRRLSDLKTDFLSMVSHDLLSPLSSVQGFVSLLLKGEAGDLAPRQAEFLGICAKALQRVTLLIDDLLDHSRIEAGVVKLCPEPVDAVDILESARRDHEPSAREKGVELSSNIPGSLPRLTADPQRLRQVLDNLLRNALKFTPKGGRVVLSARAGKKELVVSVTDTGIGLSVEEMEKIFEKYYQVEGAYSKRVRGSGLGLAICKSLVERHGGRIWVESTPGEGSRFHFSIPFPA